MNHHCSSASAVMLAALGLGGGLTRCERSAQPRTAVGQPPVAAPAAPVERPFNLAHYTDLQTALSNAKSTALSAAQASAYPAFFTAWAQADGAAAMAFAQTIQESEITAATLAALRGWGAADPAAALQWLRQYETDGHEKVLYLGQLATLVAQQSPLPPVIGPLAEAWADVDATAANSWLLTLPSSPLTQDTISQSFTQWATQDVTAASAFLTTAAPSTGRRVAIASLVQTISLTDPAAAAAWEKELGPATAER